MRHIIGFPRAVTELDLLKLGLHFKFKCILIVRVTITPLYAAASFDSQNSWEEK